MRQTDIIDISNFSPPDALCQKCKGLLRWEGDRSPSGDWGTLRPDGYECSVCHVVYEESDVFHTASRYLRSRGLLLFEKTDPIRQARLLGEIAHAVRAEECSPWAGFLDALHATEEFVHFSTEKLAGEVLGALKLASRSVRVRGFVAGKWDYGPHDPVEDARGFFVLVEPEAGPLPHNAVIVDGLLAFKAPSLNRKDLEDGANVKVVTRSGEVERLHNASFAKPWGLASHEGAYIDTGLPF